MSAAPEDAWGSWDRQIDTAKETARTWQLAFAGAMVGLVISVAGIVALSSRVHDRVFVVETDKLGYALGMAQPLTATAVPDLVERMKRYELAVYIRDARSVSSDYQAEQRQLNEMLAHTRHNSAADHFLDDWFHANKAAMSPFVRAQHETVTVEIASILPLSAKSYEVLWSEERRDLNGGALELPTHWRAELETEIVTPSDSNSIITDPLGFYVSNIEWTQEQPQ